VSEGFKVRTKEAEYPDQKPAIPFSARIDCAMKATLGEMEGEEEVAGERAESIEEVCFRTTTFAIGVVKNFEHAPARAPTPNSSITDRSLCPFNRRVRR